MTHGGCPVRTPTSVFEQSALPVATWDDNQQLLFKIIPYWQALNEVAEPANRSDLLPPLGWTTNCLVTTGPRSSCQPRWNTLAGLEEQRVRAAAVGVNRSVAHDLPTEVESGTGDRAELSCRYPGANSPRDCARLFQRQSDSCF